MRLESPPAAALSSNTDLFFLGLCVSKSPCPQSPMARIRAALHTTSVSFPVAEDFQAPWNSRTPRVYTQMGVAYVLGEVKEQWVFVLPLTCLIFPSDHPICMLPLFQDEFLLLVSPLLGFVFLPPLQSTDNAVCFPSFFLSFSQPELTRWIHLFLFQKLSVTNISAKGLIQAARDWWGARCFDHSLSPSAMSLYELTLKLFKVLTGPLCELILKKD